MLGLSRLVRVAHMNGCRTLIALALTSAMAPQAKAVTPAWHLNNLYFFQGGISGPDGSTPSGGLILGKDGNYYGTTLYGGTGGGTFFRVTPEGTESIVYAFSGAQDGQLPSKPIQGTDGNFYGTSYWGGGPDAYGIIYKVTPNGEETILQSFTNTAGGPANPGAALRWVQTVIFMARAPAGARADKAPSSR